MKHAADVIEEIRSVSGKLAKRAILKENEHNTELKAVLKLCYDRQFNYYTTVVPKVTGTTGGNTLEYALKVMVAELSTRRVTGNKAKDLVKELFQSLSEKDQQCLAYVIKRDVKAGIKEKSVLEVWPDLFQYHPYMRCSSKGEAKYPAYSELKGDGIFSRWFTSRSGQGLSGEEPIIPSLKGITRNGTPLINLNPVFASEVANLPVGVYEGEMIIEENGKVLPREVGNGIINAVFISGKKDYNKEIADKGRKVRLQLWDVITHEEYKAGISQTKRSVRLTTLEDSINKSETQNHIFMTPYEVVKDKAAAMAHYNRLVAQGEEGTILKNMDGIWKDGTSKDQIKNKVEEVVELRAKKLIPAAEGSKNEGTFGSILCESECGQLQVAVTGFTDAMRLEVYENWGYYEDKVMGVRSNGPLPPSKTNLYWSLFLPRHEEWRDKEKSTADTLENIKVIFNV